MDQEHHDNAIQDAEGWLASYKENGDLESLCMASYWLSEALRFARMPPPHHNRPAVPIPPIGDTMWLVMDIGCLHCDAKSRVLGVFIDNDKADSVAAYWNEHGEQEDGQHFYEVFRLPEPTP